MLQQKASHTPVNYITTWFCVEEEAGFYPSWTKEVPHFLPIHLHADTSTFLRNVQAL